MKISIVTPTLNQVEFLRQTSESVLAQKGDFDLEWIIIDGKSTDGTIELLQSLRDPRVRWISEPDRGQSHAINKGFALAAGDALAWLNSDDVYAPAALEIVSRMLAANPSAMWLIGECEIIDAAGRDVRPLVTRYKNRGLRRYSYRRLLRENFISQPAVFFRRELLQKTGGLDESLHWAMDYDLWLRMAQRSAPLIIDETLAQFRIHRRSKSGRVDRGQFDEQYQVASRYFGGDTIAKVRHRINVEKIVLAYRVMRSMGM